IGARVEVVTTSRTLTRELAAGSGFMGQDAPVIHCGLGADSIATAIRVHWPDGALQVVHGIPANQIITLREGVPTEVAAAGGVASGAPPRLGPCEPNPFTPSTSIRYEIAQSGPVTLSIYDLRGRKVRTLAKGQVEGGAHAVSWDGRDGAGRELPSGAYFV